jgi:hypothetical protein
MREEPLTPMSDSPPIRILDERIDTDTLGELVAAWFEDMVKYVVDVERGRIAIGGDLHADAEEVLLEAGSRQQDLWGANYYPGRGRDGCIEFTSLINISPGRGNRGMEVADPSLRARIQQITWALIGEGEAL